MADAENPDDMNLEGRPPVGGAPDRPPQHDWGTRRRPPSVDTDTWRNHTQRHAGFMTSNQWVL